MEANSSNPRGPCQGSSPGEFMRGLDDGPEDPRLPARGELVPALFAREAFLFDPRFFYPGRAALHRLILAALRRRRGIQPLCASCSKSADCGVLAAPRSTFLCFARVPLNANKNKGRNQ